MRSTSTPPKYCCWLGGSDAPAAATCGSGLTAAVVALALHRCVAAAVPIYDGAWCEYEASGLPVVVDAE